MDLQKGSGHFSNFFKDDVVGGGWWRKAKDEKNEERSNRVHFYFYYFFTSLLSFSGLRLLPQGIGAKFSLTPCASAGFALKVDLAPELRVAGQQMC